MNIASAASRANPALLKLDLYCNGARLDGSCYVEEDGGRNRAPERRAS